jgi:hypothetical protein
MLEKCALCNVLITAENDSKEHVIPNSIGGRKKITGFICDPCNNKSGDDWEKDLAKQLNPLSLFFRIKRERGDAPAEIFNTTGGEQYRLKSDGSMEATKPCYNEEIHEAGVKININARNMKEARTMLSGVKQKHPSVDLDELLENAKSESSYCPDMIQFNLSFGGQKAGRSIIKSALALAVEAGVVPEQCEHAREYLLDENGEACFGYYYEKDLVVNRPVGIPLHCVYVQGNSTTGLLLAYIEFFGVQRMVACLSSTYEGKDFKSLYAIDPVNGSELALDINLNLNIEDIHACYRYEKIPNGSIEEALSSVIPLHMQVQQEQERSRVLSGAVEKAFKGCGAKEGEILTPEHMKKVTETLMSEITPMMLHQLGLNKKRV